MVEQRNQDGRFTSEHADTDILAAVRAHEPAATSEIADEVGMTRQGADRRLRRLRDEGRVNSKKIAASLVWFTGAAPEPTNRPDPAEWKEITRKVLSRDEYTCQECGADVSETGSEIHHITPLAGGGDNSLSNLETLCPDCHRDKHRNGTLDAVLGVFAEVRGPAITSTDVADHLDCTTEAARQKLTRLYDQGRVDKRKSGRTTLYWRPEPSTPSDHAGTPTPDPAADVRDTPARETPGSAESILRELDLPGSGAKLDARIDAVLGLYEYLQDHAGEPVSRADLLDHVDADAVGYASRESFWNNFVKANSSQGRDTNALVALPGVEEWGDGEYQYNP